MTTAMAREVSAYGVPQSIIGRMVTTPPNRMARLTEADLLAMNVNFLDDVLPLAATVPRRLPTVPANAGSTQPTSLPFAAGRRAESFGTPLLPVIVPTQPSGVTPLPNSSPTPPSDLTFAAAVGYADRIIWESWVAALSSSAKMGAEWWAGQRSLPTPGKCDSTDAAFMAACGDAQRQLSSSDAKRHSDPEYRRGWNSY